MPALDNLTPMRFIIDSVASKSVNAVKTIAMDGIGFLNVINTTIDINKNANINVLIIS